MLHKKKGDPVQAGESLALIHANDMQKLQEAERRLLAAYELGTEKPAAEPLIKDIIF